MQPIIDLDKEYGIVLEGGGARALIRWAHGRRCGKQE